MSDTNALTPSIPQPMPNMAPEPAPRSALLGFIESRPQAAFASFLTLHFAIWTALPTLLYANLPLDLIEALTYGREWPLGSDKLPPLPWWLVEIMYRVFGADAAYYALAEVVVIITFALIWATARPLVGTTGALVAVLIIDGLHYFQYTAVKFNHDVIQLPFWALAGYTFHAALKRGRVGHWLLLGLAFGGALWAKYFVVMLAAPYALFLLFDRDARRALRTPGPWLGIAVALVIASPHIVWLFANNFLPFAYVDERSAPVRGWYDHLWNPALFAVGQLFFSLPTLFIAAMYLWPRSTAGALLPAVGRALSRALRRPVQSDPARALAAEAAASPHSREGRIDAGHADAFDRRIVTLLAFGPAAALMALIVASGRGAITMWGYPLWLFFGLWIVLFAPRAFDATRVKRVIAAWAVVFAAFAVAFVINYTVMSSFDHRYRAEFFPGDQLAADLTQRFHAATGKPLRYVIGTMWVAGNVAHYSPDHPEVLIDGLRRRSPWIDLDKMRAAGALVVWILGDGNRLPARFAAIAPTATVGPPFTLSPHRGHAYMVRVGWAILKPR